jgi:large subunit ribosomal protein L5
LESLDNRIEKGNFDENGNLAFGIKEHIDIPGVKYDPAVGIFGMDVCLTLENSGYRIKNRRFNKGKISKGHGLKKNDAIQFMKKKYALKIED